MKKLLSILCALCALALLAGCTPCDEESDEIHASAKPVIYLYPDGDTCDEVADAKPVIYLAPETGLDVSVRLDYEGTLTCTYPRYEDGWRVHAAPDGTLTDADGQTYRYLYWEGLSDTQYDLSSGFCVAGADTAAFLEDALARLGLNRTEANEFIIYWLPRMEPNAYNIISFQTDAYTDAARLTITPEPDTLLRVFMAWVPLDSPMEVAAQELTAPERTGFVAVEWGGAELRADALA